MRKSILLITFTVLVASPASAQLEVLSGRGLFGELGFASGTSSYDSGGYEGDSGFSVFGAQVGYMVSPMFGAGLGFASSTPEDGDATTYITPRIVLVPLRQGEASPVSVFADVHYHLISPPGDGVSASGWGISVGAARSMALTDKFSLLPHLALGYSSTTYEYDSMGKRASGSESTYSPIGFLLGATLSTAMGPGLVTLTPFLDWSRESSGEGAAEYTSTDTSFGARLGITLKK